MLRRHVGLESLQGASIVELGGAASRYLADLATLLDARVTAVDYSPRGIDETGKMFARRGICGTAILADILTADLPTDTFDVTTHWGLLEHFDDPAPVLAASARVTKPGGLVVFTMPNMAAYGATLWKRNAPHNYSKHVFHSDKAIIAACKKSGLDLERIFHTGPPLLRAAPPEKRTLGALAADAAHTALCVAGTLAPFIYTAGYSRLATTRGFVARRVS